MTENSPALWLKQFPWPRGDTNKYARGHALVVGGEMTGAGRLASHAAQRTGAGLVTVMCPRETVHLYAPVSPSLIVKPLVKGGDVATQITERKVKAALAGPGGGVGGDLRDVIAAIMDSGIPAVFDADALTVLAKESGLMARLQPHHVLTPHEGEFKRLFALDGSRETRALAAARSSGSVIILKGLQTLIAHPDARMVVNRNGTPWLATAGSGDTLAGISLALLAQGMDPFDAACAAVWTHAECGRLGGIGIIAEDIAARLPEVIGNLWREAGEPL